jgi:hypothetical protein
MKKQIKVNIEFNYKETETISIELPDSEDDIADAILNGGAVEQFKENLIEHIKDYFFELINYDHIYDEITKTFEEK